MAFPQPTNARSAARDARSSTPRWGLAAILAFLATATASAQPDGGVPDAGTASAPRWVIPQGQEPVVVRMLGGEAGLAGCRYDRANVASDRIEATFLCPSAGAPVTVVLSHRGERGCRAICSAQFEIALTAGTPPDGLVESLRQSVVRNEGDFAWTRPRRTPRRVSWLDQLRAHRMTLGFGAFLVLVVVGIVVDRRRAAKGSGPEDAGN